MKLKGSLIVTLDGPSGSGKSTASLLIARHFRIPCLDTGAMYRTVAYLSLKTQTPLEDERDIAAIAEDLEFDFEFKGEELVVSYRFRKGNWTRAGKEIRTPEISQGASKVAKFPEVRKILVVQQQKIGARRGAVVEGRDAGTVIFPRATIKFFVTASVEERAKRRLRELEVRLGKDTPSYDDVLKEMIERDQRDEEREASPSKPAEDAILFDTSGMEFNEVVSSLIDKIQKKISALRAA